MKATKILLGILLMAAVSVKAQSPFLNTSGNSFFSLEFGKPVFENSDMNKGVSTFTSVTYLAGKYALNDHYKLVAELPLSSWGYDRSGVKEDNHLAIGNIYLGAEYHRDFPTSPFRGYVEAGFRPNTVTKMDYPDKMGSYTGLMADWDRNDAYWEKYVTVQAIANVFYELDPMFTLRFRTGPSYLIPTEKEESMGIFTYERDSELFLVYSPQVWMHIDQFNVGLGMTGRYWATESGGFNENSIHQVSTYVSAHFNQLVPGIFVRVPTDKDYRDSVTLVYGLTLGVDLAPRR